MQKTKRVYRGGIGRRPPPIPHLQLYIKSFRGAEYIGSKSIPVYELSLDDAFDICTNALKRKIKENKID